MRLRRLSEGTFDSRGLRIYRANFVFLTGLSDSCLDELALEYLFPLPLLYNYVRLVRRRTLTHAKDEGVDELGREQND